ncbi:hypothetical protein ACFQ1R_03190 [Mariniflexile jejuense]|uniref:Uncharacterized protein n=1 Tax=Mariniflexile jejuense TaxID=1173582 RepID=A0ABW3JHN4_9FLAO
MKTSYLNIQILVTILFIVINSAGIAQVGIGTITPDASAMLDINTTTKGLLAPRMTTVQKNAITSPSNGLIVYDTNLGKFSYYNGSTWITIAANIERDNYVLVKSAADLPAPSAGVITLIPGTMYEINGSITLSNKIQLNGCEVAGADSNNDKLIFTGTGALFTGTKGGIIKNLTLIGNGTNSLFSMNDATQTLNLFLRGSNVVGFSSVGTITGYNLVLLDLISLASNSNGVTYTNNKNLFLLNNVWFSTNSGTFCTMTGTFDIVGISGGVYHNNTGTAIMNITGITSIIQSAHINGVSFTGTATRLVGSFSNKWEVDTPGLKTEKDDVATGTIYISTPVLTSIPNADIAVKAMGITATENLFRFDTNGGINNRLRYTGIKTRIFSVVISASITSPNSGQVLSMYIAKNGTIINSSRIQRKISNGADIGAIAVTCTVQLNTNDYVELWIANNTASKDATIESMNFRIN